MLNFERVSKGNLDDLTVIVEELVQRVSVDPECIMIVGAGCRNILHEALGHTFEMRSTTDTDLGITLSDWSVIERIDECFTATGNNGIRYWIDGLPVDILPFGAIEDPSGISTPATRGEGLVVFGFSEAYAHSCELVLPNNRAIRIVSVAGYVLLKLKAWIDRSPHFEDKDAKDLALAAYWYRESELVEKRLWGQENILYIESAGFDLGLASSRLLGYDAGMLLEKDQRILLLEQWRDASNEYLVKYFTLPPSAKEPSDSEMNRHVIDAITAGLEDAVSL